MSDLKRSKTHAIAATVVLLASVFTVLSIQGANMRVSTLESGNADKALDQPATLVLRMNGLGAMPSAYGQETTPEALAAMTGGKVHRITLVGYETDLTLPDGTVMHALTFNGTIPGPTIRVTQGDVIVSTLVIHPSNKMFHSLDHHASTISAVPNFGAVEIGKSQTYTFVAKQPGFFKYHCEGVNVIDMDRHVLMGMYGGVIVDPKNGYKAFEYKVPSAKATSGWDKQLVSAKAKEFQLIFSELYLTNDGNYDLTKVFNRNPTHATINGIPFGYDPAVTKTKGAMPLHLSVGDHVRFFLLNEANLPVNFHIVGEQLDRVTVGNKAQTFTVQTTVVGGSNDAIVDVVFDVAGIFAFVNHDYSQLFKGQAGIIIVDDEKGNNLLDYKGANPANAVPPTGPDSIKQDTTPYYLGEPKKFTSAELGM